MVLADLGSKIRSAVSKVSRAAVIDKAVVDEMLKDIGNALVAADVNVRQIIQLKVNIQRRINDSDVPSGFNKQRLIQKSVVDELSLLLDPGKKPFAPVKGRCNVIMLVGLQGSGKTTTCTKMAHFYQRKGWKACLVCADTFRAGAFDQLKQNATKAKIPFYGSYTERDPVQIAADGVEMFRREKFEVIIVDTSGRHKQETALFEEMQEVAKAVNPDESIFVMDSSIGQAARDQAEAFAKAVDVGSVVITKLDGHAKGGGALSAVAATKSPICFIGTGEHIHELEQFNTKSFVSRLLGMGDLSGLMQKMQEAKIDDQPEMAKRLMQGKISLRDMYSQFENVMKLGPISQVVSMIPGFSADMLPKGQEQNSQKRIQQFMTIMDSMTDQELDSDVKLFKQPGRIERIARGAGVMPQMVHEVLKVYQPFAKAASKMGQLTDKSGNINPSKLNPRNLAQMFDPRMLKQMGGMQGLQGMMRQMQNMDPSKMQDMMKGMGMGGMKMPF